MQRISSNLTQFWKVFFPIGWLALVILLVDGSRNMLPGMAGWLPPMLVGAVVVGTGVIVYRRFASGVVNEVWDDGAQIVVKHHGERRIPFYEIVDVTTAEPNRITLKLAAPGKDITFLGDKDDEQLVPELTERARTARVAHNLFGDVAAASERFAEVYQAHQQKYKRVNANVLMSEVFEIYTAHKTDPAGKAVLEVLERHRTSQQPEIHEWVNSFFEMLVSDRLEEMG